MATDLVTLITPTSPAAEAYRRLRVNLMAAAKDAPLRALLVVAAAADPEKATTVANLAVTFARVGKRAIVVDCDLRNPRQHAIFGVANQAGVTTALAGQAPVPVLHPTQVEGLRLLPSGPQAAAPFDLLASPGMAALIAWLRDEADVVLFDAPPVLVATDAAELAVQVDGVLLTVRAGHTRRDEAQRAREQLEKAGARVVGAALVNVAG